MVDRAAPNSPDKLLDALQRRIGGNDKPERVRGGPYDCSILVIVTDEFTLNRHTVEALLAGGPSARG